VRNIFDHIKSLEYRDRPDYDLIRNNLKSIMACGEDIPHHLLGGPITFESLMPLAVATGANMLIAAN
jgi:hypothetical protein